MHCDNIVSFKNNIIRSTTWDNLEYAQRKLFMQVFLTQSTNFTHAKSNISTQVSEKSFSHLQKYNIIISSTIGAPL